jgi:hypothetical protein
MHPETIRASGDRGLPYIENSFMSLQNVTFVDEEPLQRSEGDRQDKDRAGRPNSPANTKRTTATKPVPFEPAKVTSEQRSAERGEPFQARTGLERDLEAMA